MNDYLALAIGIVGAGIGGELLVRGVVGIAPWARVSTGIIAATVAAFATPARATGGHQFGAGQKAADLTGRRLGSNVVNVALILAIPLAFSV